MPLQANNWRALYEGFSDTLDLPMAVKGFIFVCDLMYTELQPKVIDWSGNAHAMVVIRGYGWLFIVA